MRDTVRIAPSLLSADFSRLGDEVQTIQNAGADLLHLDLMDGQFVPNLTFGPPVVRSLAPHCTAPLDAHLMVTRPEALLEDLADAGVARIAVHVETCVHLQRTLSTIRELRMSPGIAINPASSLSLLSEALAWCDFVLLMTVNPGFGGQSLIPECIGKIERLSHMIGEAGIEIAVDGGVEPANAADLTAAGARTLIAGSAVFGATDRAQAIAALRQHALEGLHR